MLNLPNRIHINPDSLDRFERVIGMRGATLKQLIDVAEVDVSSDLVGVDLSGVDFGDLDLTGYDLSFSNLSEANLSDVKLGDVRMEVASVSQTVWPENLGILFEENLMYRLNYNMDYIFNLFHDSDGSDYFLDNYYKDLGLALLGIDLNESFMRSDLLVSRSVFSIEEMVALGFLYTKSDFQNSFHQCSFPKSRVRGVSKEYYEGMFGDVPKYYSSGGFLLTLGELAHLSNMKLCKNASVLRARLFDTLMRQFS